MKKLKAFIAVFLSLALMGLTGCETLDKLFADNDNGTNVGTGDDNKPDEGKDDDNNDDNGGGNGGGSNQDTVYSVTLNPNGGTLSVDITEYTAGSKVNLPKPKKEHSTFAGWYESATFGGNAVTSIIETDTGNKVYYAKWIGDTYTLTYYIDGKATDLGLGSYTYGETTVLPVLDGDQNTTFNGWYEDSALTGTKITSLSATDFGDKVFYAEWVSTPVVITEYNISYDMPSAAKLSKELNKYTFGVETELPTATLSGYRFDGWYLEAGYKTPISKITAETNGDLTLYGKFTSISSDNLTLSAYGGYEEGAYVEFAPVKGVELSNIKVSYASSGSSTYKQIDSQLIRDYGEVIRADIVGIAAGNYTVKVEAGAKSVTQNVAVTAYDRSGYAHFNYTDGVGAYKDDGTPKSNAVIVYVDEATKNTASAKIGSKTYKGLANILNAATSASTPVIVRILGRISAPTWAHEGNEPMIKYTKAGTKLTPAEAIEQTKSKFGIELSTSGYKQSDLTKLGFKLETGISALDGLTSTMKLGSDCCWNNMSIGGSSKKPTNITVEGIGTDAEIFQWGFTWNYANSVEIRNITFDDYTEDACSFQGNTNSGSNISNFNSSRVWVHNCTFNEGMNYWDTSDDQDKGEGDGATDFKAVSNITVSYNRYFYNHKTGLVGSSADSYTANVTFHHNFYDQCNSRLPMGRQANIHMYNNYYRSTRGYCLSARNNMYAFVEGCYFEDCNDTIRTETDAVVKVWASEFVGCSYDSSYAVILATSRKQVVDNSNFMNGGKTSGYCLDTDSSKFYLNSDGTTKVTLLTNATTAKWNCVNDAGVHKANGWVNISTDAKLKEVFPIVK